MAGELGRTTKLYYSDAATAPALDSGYTYVAELVSFSTPISGGEVENRYLNTGVEENSIVDYVPTGAEITLEGSMKNFAGNETAGKFKRGVVSGKTFYFLVVEDAHIQTPVVKTKLSGFFTQFDPSYENDTPREADFTVRVRSIDFGS